MGDYYWDFIRHYISTKPCNQIYFVWWKMEWCSRKYVKICAIYLIHRVFHRTLGGIRIVWGIVGRDRNHHWDTRMAGFLEIRNMQEFYWFHCGMSWIMSEANCKFTVRPQWYPGNLKLRMTLETHNFINKSWNYINEKLEGNLDLPWIWPFINACSVSPNTSTYTHTCTYCTKQALVITLQCHHLIH